ncbi:hypothetical protein GDO81_007312 [Engystomops pustulosus]|uniref:Secreted protein n=1 Tax=Engystomops pustulosus TaxID=76066 RepID=A0AAV7C763_ENGPU|nr:hypothetical protein GDO81_007312 [Engystomops pustulosus]
MLQLHSVMLHGQCGQKWAQFIHVIWSICQAWVFCSLMHIQGAVEGANKFLVQYRNCGVSCQCLKAGLCALALAYDEVPGPQAPASQCIWRAALLVDRREQTRTLSYCTLQLFQGL